MRLSFGLLRGWFAAAHLTARWRDIIKLTATFCSCFHGHCFPASWQDPCGGLGPSTQAERSGSERPS